MNCRSRPSTGFCLVVFCVLVLSLVTVACTSAESPASAPARPTEVVAATPTETPAPTSPPPTPTPSPEPTDTPPPTSAPAPTFRPQPVPTTTPTATPRLTYTPQPRSTSTPIPTFASRPTNTPTVPSPIKDLENGAWLDQNRRLRAMELRTLPWIADGVDEAEKKAAELLIGAARWYPDVFSSLIKMPWVQDSITQAETAAIRGLRWAARYNHELAQAMLQKSWVQDDITADEGTTLQYLYWMVWYEDEPVSAIASAAIRILDMPFLDDVSSADALALRSIERLGDSDADALLKMMSHPKINDGITDEEAKMVALLGGTYSYRPQSGDVLLQGTGVYWEERTIELPISGEVSLAVVRIRDQSTASMDFLEHSVRSIEEFMGISLPTHYIALLYDDAVFPGSGGTNFGTHMAIQLLYDVEGGYWWDYTPFVIGHEVAHYYWRGNRDWIDEGASEVLGSISEYARDETPIGVTNRPCAAVKTIGELEAMDPDALGTRGFNCNYSLGEQIFLDLYNSLGEETFRQGFRALYLKSQAEDYSDSCEGTELGICHLAAAFKADVSDAQAATVDEIVARWYGPLP